MTLARASLAIAQRPANRIDHELVERVRAARKSHSTHEGFRVGDGAFQPTAQPGLAPLAPVQRFAFSPFFTLLSFAIGGACFWGLL
ncbi:hypothetical protein FHT01_002342 [Sphingomonas japonica]|uniref:Uncharacterized protein n=1 Tax=Sphingomonas japonica TaxID=511662 RepID=A0ABX0U2L0_9SPHN|nr:hypothetical protein [Sphingomonas japonica]